VPARVVIVLDEPGFAERIAYALKRDGINATALAGPMAPPASVRGGWLAILRGIVTPNRSIYPALLLVIILLGGAAGWWAVGTYHSIHDRFTREKDAFIYTSGGMDFTIAYYVQFIVNQKPLPDEAIQLVNSNILRQRQLLQDVSKYLPQSDQHLVRDYADRLLQFKNAIPLSTDAMHMHGFWESANKLLAMRNEIIRKLQS
jgi:hypothetical protein